MCQEHSALKLLFYVSKVLGFAPYTLLENGVLMPSLAAKRYSTVLCFCVIAAEIEVFAFQNMKNAPILITGFVLISTSSWMTHLVSVFMSMNAHKTFGKITKKLNIMDSMLRQSLYVHRKQFYFLLAQLLVGLVSLGSYLFWANFYIVFETSNVFVVPVKLYHLAVNFICIFGDYIVVLQYINLVLFTAQHFARINEKFAELEHLCSQNTPTARVSSKVTFRSISQVTSPNPVGFHLRDQVSALVDMHNKLLDTIRNINSTYSLQILFIVVKIFVHITFCLHLFVVIFLNGFDAQYKVHALFFCFWSSFHLILIIASCDYTKRKVSVYYDTCLFHIVLNFTKNNYLQKLCVKL